MNIPTAGRTVQLLKRICDTKTATRPLVDPQGEKHSLPLRGASAPFPRAAPESKGISSDHIRHFLEELRKGEDLYTQTVLILRDGTLLTEAVYGAQTTDAPKHTFSACKSITSLAIGLLIDDGLLRLDDTVGKLFSDLLTNAAFQRFKDLTVEDLLTMRSGIPFAEVQSAADDRWLYRIFSAPLLFTPGSQFQYNSINSYLLSAIIRRVSGRSMTSLLQQRLFAPMGITDTLWERSDDGIEKGGWGLYIRPEDMAKLGQLVLDGGIWQGKQLISHSYLTAATAAHVSPPAELGDFDYGYQIWTGRKEKSFLFNGMLGQNVLGFRENGILIVTNAGADTDYQQSRFFEIVRTFFGRKFPDHLPEDPDAAKRLRNFTASLSYYNRPPEPIPPIADRFFDRVFTTDAPCAPSTGLLPVLLQILHNSYGAGLASVALTRRENVPELIYQERDAIYRLSIGLGRPILSELSFYGNYFRVAAHGRFTHDEEDRPVFVIRLDFAETPSVRIIKLVLTRTGLLLRQSETPGGPYCLQKLRSAARHPLLRPLLRMAIGSSDDDFFRCKIQNLMSPELSMIEAQQ